MKRKKKKPKTLMILCVDMFNMNESVLMAAVLKRFLKGRKEKFYCESAGILQDTTNGNGASEATIAAGRDMGINLSQHRGRQFRGKGRRYCLIVAADGEAADYLVKTMGINGQKIYNANIPSSLGFQYQEDYEDMARKILTAMYDLVRQYFPLQSVKKK